MKCTHQPPTEISISGHFLTCDNHDDLCDCSSSCSQLKHQAKRSHMALLVELHRADSWYVSHVQNSSLFLHAERLTDQKPSLCVALLPSEHSSHANIGPFAFQKTVMIRASQRCPRRNLASRLLGDWASSQLASMQPRRDRETYATLSLLNPKRQ